MRQTQLACMFKNFVSLPAWLLAFAGSKDAYCTAPSMQLFAVSVLHMAAQLHLGFRSIAVQFASSAVPF